MPIRINLLEEEQKQKLARKRDPVMMAVRLGVMAVFAVLVYSLILYPRERSLKEQLTALHSEWSLCEKKFQHTDEKIKDLKKVAARTELMRWQVKNRFLWAPQLELYKDIVPTNVQITRLVGRREVVTPAPSANSKAAPPSPTEMIKVTLEGVAEGRRPELVVQNFLTQIKSDRKLAEYVDEVKLISLNKGNVSAVHAEGDNAGDPSSAKFVIEILYKQKAIGQA